MAIANGWYPVPESKAKAIDSVSGFESRPIHRAKYRSEDKTSTYQVDGVWRQEGRRFHGSGAVAQNEVEHRRGSSLK